MTTHHVIRISTQAGILCALAATTVAAELTLDKDADSRYTVSLDGGAMARFDSPELSDMTAPQVRVTQQGDSWHRVEMTWDVRTPVKQDELAVEIELLFEPSFHWVPHLAPAEGFVIGQHVFRAPAIIAVRDLQVLAIVPDLDLVGIRPSNPWFMDLDAPHQKASIGMTLTDIPTRYADKLITLQDDQGFFPGWLHPESLEPAEVMSQTPETAMSVTFLLKLADLTSQPKYRHTAIKAMDILLVEVVLTGRWEDYETYWSCCGFGQRDHVGKKFERNNMFKQNNLSIFWTAEALLATYRATGNKTYLRWGRRTLDELAMYQQVWQPPFIYVPALGGFGVMNFDGEWNDSRQCLFAELFMDYYRETGDTHLFERGVAALKSSFIMMYCPENPQQKMQWEKVHRFFGPEDYGFTMENYGHGGRVSPAGGGIGTFTIYDWGNGAASEARNRIHDHYGDVFVDRQRLQAFGIDSIGIRSTDEGIVLRDLAGTARDIKVMFEDGSSRTMKLHGEAILRPNPPLRRE